MYDKIMAEIAADNFYNDNFPNPGQRFVAWYLHRVLLLDVHETRAAITDGQNDKQIDAIVVEDGEDRRVRVLQGKFVKPEAIDGEPLREVLSAWTRLKDLPKLQLECSGKLAERLETMRLALEDDYDVQFELLTTGSLTPSAVTDFEAFKQEMADSQDFSAGLTLVDSELIETRLSEAEERDLPELMTEIELENNLPSTMPGSFRQRSTGSMASTTRIPASDAGYPGTSREGEVFLLLSQRNHRVMPQYCPV
jgi:hypothetical protein